MVEFESQQPPSKPREKQQAHSVAASAERARSQLDRLLLIGTVDEQVTSVFQRYRLPGQEFVRKDSDGTQTLMWRGLIDPEEVAVRVQSLESFRKLRESAKEWFDIVEVRMRRDGGSGLREPWTQYEIILGDPSHPEHCIRTRLCAIREQDDGTFELLLEGNIEHEKDRQAPMLGVRQPVLDENGNQAPGQNGLSFGQRTGFRIGHQRAPQSMTRFIADRTKRTLDPSTEVIYIPALDPDKLTRPKFDV